VISIQGAIVARRTTEASQELDTKFVPKKKSSILASEVAQLQDQYNKAAR